MRVLFWKLQSSKPDFKDEPEKLSKLVLAKLNRSTSEGFDEFVKYRYWRPFQHSVDRANLFSTAFTVFTLIVIAGGVTSSFLTEVSWEHSSTAIAVIGLSIAVAAAVNRLWRPGLRAALRHRTANELRREGWSFACNQGHYKNPDGDPAEIFFREVERINAPAEGVDEQQPKDTEEQ